MSLAILGMGTALPPHSITQDRAAALSSEISGHTPDQARRLAALYRRTGIAKRHIALLNPLAQTPELPASADQARGPTTRWRMRRYDEHVRALARQAARRALSAAAMDPGGITHLVTVSCTGFAAPGFDLALIKDLHLAPTVQRTHVGFMGCHGALNGLRVARAFTGSDPAARVLLCAAELCSLHFQYGWNADLAVSNALFADGAAALVGAPDVDCDARTWRVVECGSCLVPDTEDVMSWHIGDHGFEMVLSPQVCRIISQQLRPWLSGWLGRLGLTPEEVPSWAVHPGGPRVLDVVEDALGLGRQALEDSRDVLSSCGNMSSPTVLFILDRLRQRQAPRPCVALAFGPGLTIEAALLR